MLGGDDTSGGAEGGEPTSFTFFSLPDGLLWMWENHNSILLKSPLPTYQTYGHMYAPLASSVYQVDCLVIFWWIKYVCLSTPTQSLLLCCSISCHCYNPLPGLLFLTLSLGEDGEQIAAVLPGMEEVSVAVLSSWEDSGETGHSSLSEPESLDDRRASKAEERRPKWMMASKVCDRRTKHKNTT